MVPNSFTFNTLLGEELEKVRQSFWRSLVERVYHFKFEIHSYIVISLPLSNVSNCWHERQRFISKMMNQICLLFLFVNYSLEEKGKRNKESHSQFHSRYCSKPLNPSISMHILHTVLCTFLVVLVMRICWTNQVSFPFFSWPLCLTEHCRCKNNIVEHP